MPPEIPSTIRRRDRLAYAGAALIAASLVAAPAHAWEPVFELPVLGAVVEPAVFDSYALPIAPWSADALPVEIVEGQVDRRAWQLDAPGTSLLSVLAPLRDQLVAQGYETLLDCEARRCGGFDFRFNIEIMPEPGMHVDLNSFRFLSARRGADVVSLLVSHSGGAAFVQVVTVGAEALPVAHSEAAPVMRGGVNADPLPAPPLPVAPIPAPSPEMAGSGPQRLDAGLPLALDDLVFSSGSSSLAEGDYPSLAVLADWLRVDPGRKLILVGHTDLSGAMEANIALSKRRAAAVREALIRDFGISPGRLGAEGAGPLAPRAENATEEGRHKNRRVEAIPAPT